MVTWLDKLTELTSASMAAMEKARVSGDVADWETAAASAAAVTQHLHEYRKAGSPGFDTSYRSVPAAVIETQQTLV